jgi:hypothetical protein
MKVSRFELEAPAPKERAPGTRTEADVRAEARAAKDGEEDQRSEDTEEPGYGHGV